STTTAANIPGGRAYVPEEIGVLGLTMSCCAAESSRRSDQNRKVYKYLLNSYTFRRMIRHSNLMLGGAVLKDTQEVVKHSAAIQIQNNITLLQRRAWNVLLANAYDELPTQETHQVKVAELMEKLEFSSKNDEYLKGALKALVGYKVEWNVLDKDNKWEWGVTTLLAEARIKDGVCTYAYGPMLRERLHNPNIYARISLSMQNKFDSKHALALWELCLDFLDKIHNYGETPFVPLERFRELMGIPETMYSQFKEFNRRVIKEPIEEVNAKTDFHITVEYQRKHRQVTAIRFKFRRILQLPTQQTKQATLFTDLEDMPAVVKVLQEAGLATQDAWKIWQDGFEYVESGRRPSGGDFETYIQEKIHLLQHQPEGKIKSRTGFLLDAIRKNYANAEFEQARRVQKSVVQAQERKALEQEKERLEREHEERWATLCLQMVQEIPVFVEAVAQNLGVEVPFLRTQYDSERPAVENYQKSVFFAAHVNEKLRQEYPNRFIALDQEYARKAAEINHRLGAL
ncbi:MAG TPA: replication initiation protein, partial [Candidatus Saccharimonadia bacterium]|nr:replication initiation protein [Candidatus Saccharimonadia bacterium]